MHLMTVCLGNICRSPAAEAVLVHALEQEGLDDVTVSSAGTADYHVDETPHHLSVAVGEDLGYAFTTRGIHFRPEHFDQADLILVMDQSNREDVLALARTQEQRGKVRLLGEFASTADSDAGPDAADEVPDPYGHPRAQFEAMYRQIEDAVPGVIAWVREHR